MNLSRPLIALFALVAYLIGGTGAASAEATIDIKPVIEKYETCVADSDPGLAYRCTAMVSTGEEFSWPAGGLDPRVGPVYVEGGVFICASVPNMLVLATHSPSTGRNIQLELNSPAACSGNTTGVLGPTTSMDIDPQYDPRSGPTLIRFEDDLGQDSFNVGVCTPTPGNLAVFVIANDGSRAVVVLYTPAICSVGHP